MQRGGDEEGTCRATAVEDGPACTRETKQLGEADAPKSDEDDDTNQTDYVFDQMMTMMSEDGSQPYERV